MHNPWRVIGVAIGATLLAVVILNAQFFWLTLQHQLAPNQVSEPEPTSVVAQVADKLPGDVAAIRATGISNTNLSKIPIGIPPSNTLDSDNDGISDILERVLGTNPNKLDTDGDRISDFSEILINHNPLGKGTLPVDVKFANQQKGKYFLQVDGNGELWYVSPINARRYYISNAKSSLQNTEALSHSETVITLPANTLSISSLGLEAPVIYAIQPNEKAFQEALRNGVAHYPGTARPGELGNVYIFGHSSDYRWGNGQFKTVFAILPDIKVGTDVVISDASANVYTYRVIEKKVVLPTETKYLDQYDYKRKILTLQTSWPIGTALKRYVVIAELVEK